MTRPRRENEVGPDGRARQALVTAVYKGDLVVGAHVWARGKDEAVFVEGSDLKRVAEELGHLDNSRRVW